MNFKMTRHWVCERCKKHFDTPAKKTICPACQRKNDYEKLFGNKEEREKQRKVRNSLK